MIIVAGHLRVHSAQRDDFVREGQAVWSRLAALPDAWSTPCRQT